MKSIIEALASPDIVAYFQRLCGVQWKFPEKDNPIYPVERRNGTDGNDAVIIKNKAIYHAMQLGSQLAGEPFYYVFLPVCSWIFDVAVARKTLTKLALVMYIGQSAKDIWRQNRPRSPPVIRLEKLYETEYGMPSTHAMAGTAASFALFEFSRQLYQVPEKYCIVAAGAWTTWIAASRVYLGMHTVWQVLVGVVGALGILHNSVSMGSKLDRAILDSGSATCGAVVTSIALSCLIFRLDSGKDPETGKPRWNTSRGDQAEIMGFTAGFLVGSRWAILHNLYTYNAVGGELLPIPSIDIKSAALRFLVGGLITVPAALVIRKLCFLVFSRLAGVSTKDKTAAKRHPKVELPYKYTASFFSGALSTSIVPWVLNEIGLW